MSMAITSFESGKKEREGSAVRPKQVKANLYGPSGKGQSRKQLSFVRQ